MPLFTARERTAVAVIAALIVLGWTFRLAEHLRDAPSETTLIRDAVPVPAELAGAHVDPAAPLDINTATAADLEALPMIGPVRAEAIVAWREEHGAFSAIDELLDVGGIGPATLGRIRDQITIVDD